MEFKEFFKFDKPRKIFTLFFFIIILLGEVMQNYCNEKACFFNSSTLETLIALIFGGLSMILNIPFILTSSIIDKFIYNLNINNIFIICIGYLFSFLIEYLILSIIINKKQKAPSKPAEEKSHWLIDRND